MLATLSPAPRWRSSSTTSAAAAGRADDCPSNPSPQPPLRFGEGVGGRGLSFSRQFPALAVLAAEELLRLRHVADAHRLRVPFETLGGAVGDVAQVVRLGQQSAVAEVTRRRRAGLAGTQPLGVMADRLGNRPWRIFEPREVLFWQQDVLEVLGQEHPL